MTGWGHDSRKQVMVTFVFNFRSPITHNVIISIRVKVLSDTLSAQIRHYNMKLDSMGALDY